ncbi:hypothetical protein A4X13_0g7975 [Tilletia indica]|uniref:Uncharacterized protein n=1 Tax=Tilletia indica TaxID=43049 RepID=A0A177TUY8_9BASI|nr:hypothetical protein A4X13_0g7975 [Tilletia indica]
MSSRTLHLTYADDTAIFGAHSMTLSCCAAEVFHIVGDAPCSNSSSPQQQSTVFNNPSLPGVTLLGCILHTSGLPAGVVDVFPSVTSLGGVLPTSGIPGFSWRRSSHHRPGVTDILPDTGLPGGTDIIPTDLPSIGLPGGTDIYPALVSRTSPTSSPLAFSQLRALTAFSPPLVSLALPTSIQAAVSLV